MHRRCRLGRGVGEPRPLADGSGASRLRGADEADARQERLHRRTVGGRPGAHRVLTDLTRPIGSAETQLRRMTRDDPQVKKLMLIKGIGAVPATLFEPPLPPLWA